jgi:hypothetical protein
MILFRFSTRLAPRLAAATAATLLLGVSHASAWTGTFDTPVHVDGCVVTVTGNVLHESTGKYYLKAIARATTKAPVVAPQTNDQVVYKNALAYTGSYTMRKGHRYDDFSVTLGPTNGLLSGGVYKLTITAKENTDKDTDKDDNQIEVLDQATVTVGACPGGSHDGAATPELGSGELLATGLLPIGAVLLYRRRRARHAARDAGNAAP